MTHTQTARMHVSLNAKSIEASVAFYRALFGAEPTKQRGDYAKFTLDEPGLVLSLNAAAAGAEAQGGALSHLGFQVAGDDELDALRNRVTRAGLTISLDEPGVTCCYAVQNKFWVTDPDGNAWEFYRFLEDAPTHSVGAPATGAGLEPADGGACCGPSTCC